MATSFEPPSHIVLYLDIPPNLFLPLEMTVDLCHRKVPSSLRLVNTSFCNLHSTNISEQAAEV